MKIRVVVYEHGKEYGLSTESDDGDFYSLGVGDEAVRLSLKELHALGAEATENALCDDWLSGTRVLPENIEAMKEFANEGKGGPIGHYFRPQADEP